MKQPMKHIVPFLMMAAIACGSQAEGDDLLTPTGSSSGAGSSGTTSSSSSGGSSSSSSSGGVGIDAGTASDAGTGTETSVQVDAGTGAFEGAPAFVMQAGNSARKSSHQFNGNTPNTNPAKQACLTCHSAAGGETRFTFAGTLFKDSAGTMPLSNAEVRVRNPAGQAVLVHTDQDGNFFTRGAVAFPAKVGARTATATKLMSGDITSGDCNKCHDGVTTSFAYVN